MKDAIVQMGDAVLRKTAKPVPQKDFGSRKLANLISRMKKALAAEKYGVALAAPQVGSPVRLFIIGGHVFKSEAEGKEDAPAPEDRVFINPVLSRLSKKKVELSEGCLSVRGKYGTVMRHEKASVKAQDESGKTFTYQGTGLLAHIFQHECDHLDGVLYVDKAIKLEEDDDMQGARVKLKEKHGV